MQLLLILHSWFRWVVLILALAAIIKGIISAFKNQPWSERDELFSKAYTYGFAIQYILGLILYSGTALGWRLQIWYQQSLLRLSMEHVMMMTIALIIAIYARGRVKRYKVDLAKHRAVALGFSLSLVIVLVATPVWHFVF